MIIGHLRPNYAERRNILWCLPGAEYIEIPDRSRHLAYRARQINATLKYEVLPVQDAENIYISSCSTGADILHFINAVCLGWTPWVSTFETIIPRFRSTLSQIGSSTPVRNTKTNLWLRLALRALSGRRCRKLIAMSETALAIQTDFLASAGSSGQTIFPKLVSTHPPQRREITGMAEKPNLNEREIRFMFVGGSFFRKGGKELLDAFDYLRNAEMLKNIGLPGFVWVIG